MHNKPTPVASPPRDQVTNWTLDQNRSPQMSGDYRLQLYYTSSVVKKIDRELNIINEGGKNA